MKEEEKTISLREALYVIFKWKRLIVGIFTIIILTAGLVTFLSPPIYKATAKVLLKRERPDIILTTEKSDSIRRPITSRDIQAEIEIIKNRSLLENVVKIAQIDTKGKEKEKTVLAYILLPLEMVKNSYNRIHSKREMSELEKHVYELTKHLNINEIKDSDIFEISYESKHPEEAKKIVNVLTDQYIDYRLDLYKTSQAYEFFQGQLAILEQNLKESTQALRSFEEKYDSIPSATEKERLYGQLSEAETSLRRTEIEEEEVNQRIAFLRNEFEKQLDIGPGQERLSEKVLDGLKEQLVTLQLNRSDLLQKYTQNHPQVIAVEREIRSLQELMRNEENKPLAEQLSGERDMKDYCSKECLEAESRLATIKIRKKSLKDQVQYYKNRLSNFQTLNFTLKELERKVRADEEAYNIYLDKLKESEVFLELDKMKVINATILQYADTPVKPIKPKKTKNLLLAILLGLMMSFGSAFTLEYFNHGVKNQDDIERFLNIKVLASIPFKNGEK